MPRDLIVGADRKREWEPVTIDLYTWSTPNGRKISIALEELGLAYAVHPINITKDEQFAPDYLKISPNNKNPAIVDPEGPDGRPLALRSEEPTSELQSLMRISYAVFCLKTKLQQPDINTATQEINITKTL